MASIGTISPSEVKEAGLCETLNQLYEPPARRLINRLFRALLDQLGWVGSEVLGNSEKLTAVTRSTSEWQRSLQMLAGAQAREFNAELHKRLRTMQAMADELIGKLREIEQKLAPHLTKALSLNPGEFSSIFAKWKKIVGPENHRMALCILLAQRIGKSEGFQDRASALLDLLETEADTALVLELDEFLSEILDASTGLRDLLGKSSHLGQRLLETFALIHKGKGYPVQGTEASVPGQRLAAILARYDMPSCQSALTNNFLRGIHSGVPISGGTGMKELLALIDFQEKISTNNVPFGGESVAKEIRSRAARQISPEELESFVREEENEFPSRFKQLIDLRDSIQDEACRRQINDFIRKLFDRREFDTIVTPKEGGVSKRLRNVSQTYQAVKSSEFPEGVQERLLEQLETIQLTFLHRQQILKRIEQQAGNPVKAVIQFSDLLLNGLITPGRNAETIRQAIRSHLGRSDFTNYLFAGASSDDDRQNRLNNLRSRLERLGLTDSLPASSA